jgi:hypothetical protein
MTDNVSMMDALRTILRKQQAWIEFQELNREGWRAAVRRRRIQRRILATQPLRTAREGTTEVRVLTWRRDWINVIWALKSFYHFAQVDYPLFIHDGGLAAGQDAKLARHFPDATFISKADADARVAAILEARKLSRCLAYRKLNPTTRKLFDFYLFSTAKYVITIDSDIVFFKRPDALIAPPHGWQKNLYNKDSSYQYSMPLDELESNFGVRPPPLINSGLNVSDRESMDFQIMDRWLENPKLFADRWVTEQTLHAMCSTRHGVEFLPDTYLVSTEPGLRPNLVCKHYPGFFRPLLYSEGMAKLLADGFLDASTTRRREVMA